MSAHDDPLFDEGYQAYFDGAEKKDNPHPEGSDGYEAWRKGWKEADEEGT